jgi:hypothetical protein
MTKLLLVGVAIYAAMLALQILAGVTVKRREG